MRRIPVTACPACDESTARKCPLFGRLVRSSAKGKVKEASRGIGVEERADKVGSTPSELRATNYPAAGNKHTGGVSEASQSL